jgi:hypothetical protein
MAFNGPAFFDTLGGTPGTALSAAVLNTLLLVQTSYLISGGIATGATGANPPVITQPSAQFVINSGTACAYLNVAATTIPCGAASSPQDNYIDVTIGGTYTVTSGAVGFTPAAVAANALRLYKATTGALNVGVASFTTLANTSPFAGGNVMLNDGSNAAPAVTLGGNLTVTGATTLNNDALLNAVLRTTGSTPTLSAAFGAAAGTGPSGLTVTGNANWGNLTFTTGTSPVTGTVITLSCTPGGGRTLLGILINGNLNSAASIRYISQTVVTNSSGTFSVGITVANSALAASTAYVISYMLLWA